MPEHNLTAALSDLWARSVQFIVVGGVAAVLHGAPVQTFDIDFVYSLEPANVDRILGFLAETDAIFRMQPPRRLRPERSHLAGGDHLNLQTRYGPMDLLGTIGRGLGYADLLPHSREIEIGDGIRVRVLDLETVIAIKA
jgi:predicted nucleotidyltransferase